MNEAVLFPGQGAQFAGMGRDFCVAFPRAQETFDEASQALGFSLSDLCWDQAETINRTDVAQPAIFVTGAAVMRVAMERGLDPVAAPLTAGLSLGEYTALWFADALSFTDAVRLVRLRGEAMQAASEEIPSSMVSLMGATREQAEVLCQAASSAGICSVANLNAPGQVIASGELAALDALEALAKEHGVRRTKRLVVAGGFHSECMRPAARKLAEALAEVEVREPRIPVITNVTGRPESRPEVIRQNLSAQVCAPVLWEASMRWATEQQDVANYVEPAPGRVLAGLMKKINPDAQVRSLAEPEDLSADL